MASRGSLLALLLAAGCGFGGGGYSPVQTAFNRGVYFDSLGDREASIAEYRAALDEDPDDHRARFNLALACELRAEDLAGGPQHARAEELWAIARAEYERILREHPDHPRASLNLAALEWAEDPAAGQARLRGLIERQPDRAEPRAALAAHLLRAGEDVEALSLLQAARRLEPASYQVNLLLGDAQRAVGEFDAAREAYQRALARDDEDLSALLALAELEVEAGDQGAAVVAYERVLLIDPDNLGAHLGLVVVYDAAGELEQAVQHLWAAQAIHPEGLAGVEVSRWLAGVYRELAEREEAKVGDGDGDGG